METKKVLHIEYPQFASFDLMRRLVLGYGANLYQVSYVFLDIDQIISEVNSVEDFSDDYAQINELHSFDIIVFILRVYPSIYITSEFIKDIKRVYLKNDKPLPKLACVNFCELNDDTLKKQQQIFPDFFISYKEVPIDPSSFRQKWDKFVNS